MAFSTLAGCSIIEKNNDAALKAEAVKVGSTVLNQKDVVDLWTEFYNQNSSYFYYYDNDQIVEIFYKNIVLRYIVLQEVEKLITNGTIKYTQKDDANVWLNVFKSFEASINSREKSLMLQNGTKEEDLPKRLASEDKTNSSDVKKYLYEDYTFDAMNDYECKYSGTNRGDALNYAVGKNVTNQKVSSMIELFETKYLGVYAEELDEDQDVEDAYNNATEFAQVFDNATYYLQIDDSQMETREYAYKMLVGSLILSNKAEAKTTDRAEVLTEKFKQQYISAYESYLQTMYQTYIKSLITDNTSEYYSLTKEAIITRYLQLLGKNILSYKTQENYVSLLESEAKDSLLMYYYQGEYYYFSVQHLLVNFDGTIKANLNEQPGKNSEASVEQYNAYKNYRNNYCDTVLGLGSWEDYDNVVYCDKDGYAVYEIDITGTKHQVYFDPDKVVEKDDELDDDEQPTAYYYQGATEPVYLTQGEFDTCTRATMTVGQVLTIFNNTYSRIMAVVDDTATYVDVDAVMAKLDELYQSDDDSLKIEYKISEDFVKAYRATGADKPAVAHKIYANLFLQHAYRYSSNNDALKNTLSGKVGMIISNEPDNNKSSGSTYVSEFTNDARALLANYLDNLDNHDTYPTTLSSDNFIISDYGIHIVIINDVYRVDNANTVNIGAPITGDLVSYENLWGTKTGAALTDAIDEAIDILQKTYITTASSQTVYEYFYEIIRDELVGSNGTLYTIVRNKLYNKYMDEDKAEYYSKLTYDQLLEYMKG